MSTLFQQSLAQQIIKNNHIWVCTFKFAYGDCIFTLLFCLCVCPSLCLVRFGMLLRRSTHCQYNESVHRKEQLASRTNTIQ